MPSETATVTPRLWVVDDDRSIRWVLERALAKAGFAVTCFDSGDAALTALQQEAPDVLVTDIRMPGLDGLALLGQFGQRLPELPVIVMTAHSDLDSAVAAFDGGAFDYLPKPFDLDDMIALARRACRREPAKSVSSPARVPDIIGEAPAMQQVFRTIGRLARSTSRVLISGESGTGKELVAHALHQHSQRRDGPFVALNVAAIPHDLLESELFGHERGSFTGAQARRVGRFEQADGGTLFLDEIGDMPAPLQTRLLRVLADAEFYRVGGTVPVRVDVRIVAATHQDLEALVARHQFREDLFHRLNVIRIRLPALRERREDIALLMRHFLARAAGELGVPAKHLSVDAINRLQEHDWPGNVRQLENIAHWLTVMAPGAEIRADDLPPELHASRHEVPVSAASPSGQPAPCVALAPDALARSSDMLPWQQALRDWASACLARGEAGLLPVALRDFERTLIEVALAQTGGRRQEAARLLGWGRNTLTRKLNELKLAKVATDDD